MYIPAQLMSNDCLSSTFSFTRAKRKVTSCRKIMQLYCSAGKSAVFEKLLWHSPMNSEGWNLSSSSCRSWGCGHLHKLQLRKVLTEAWTSPHKVNSYWGSESYKCRKYKKFTKDAHVTFVNLVSVISEFIHFCSNSRILENNHTYSFSQFYCHCNLIHTPITDTC